MSEMGVRDYEVCGDCKWLCGERKSIGIKCVHPDRPFVISRYTAAYKYNHTRACTRMEKKNE